jgi:hypothetical protein
LVTPSCAARGSTRTPSTPRAANAVHAAASHESRPSAAGASLVFAGFREELRFCIRYRIETRQCIAYESIRKCMETINMSQGIVGVARATCFALIVAARVA